MIPAIFQENFGIKETGKIVVNPEQAETVKLIFRLFLELSTKKEMTFLLSFAYFAPHKLSKP